MKTSTLMLCGALVVCIPSDSLPGAEIDAAGLFAQLDSNGDRALTSAEISPEKRLLFDRLTRTGDANEDGQLSREEFEAALDPQRPEKAIVEKLGSQIPGADALVVIIARIDANGDRKLELDEAPSRFRFVARQLIERGDQNKDGLLDSRELSRGGRRLGMIAEQAVQRMEIDVSAELARLPRETKAALDQMSPYGGQGEALANPKQAEQMFERLDANGDGQVEPDEVPEQVAGRFERLIKRGDRDRDGKLSRDELLRISRTMAAREKNKPDVAETRQIVRRLLKQFDENKDGVLSRQETPRRLARRFDQADGNKSGLLEKPELLRIAGALARSTSNSPDPVIETDRVQAKPRKSQKPENRRTAREEIERG